MRKTNTLIFLSIALKLTKIGPRSSVTPFLVRNRTNTNAHFFV